jgi:hypothetical protein
MNYKKLELPEPKFRVILNDIVTVGLGEDNRLPRGFPTVHSTIR